MKWHIPTFSELYTQRKAWRRWFAWRPVRLLVRGQPRLSGDWAWLEYVERGDWSGHEGWCYQPLEEDAQ